MNRYARIQDGLVAEIIEPFVRRDEDRPPAPEQLPEDAQLPAEEWALREEQQAAHDSYRAGPVPIEERFPAEMVATMVAVPGDSQVDQGWSYSGGVFTAPPAPPGPTAPRVVSRRQGRRALLAAGLLDQVQTVIDALPAKQRAEAQIDWDDATEFDRESELIQALAPALGLDAEALDELFVAAATY